MTLTLASLEKIQDWDQVPTILVVDHTANCFGNEMQFLLANEWTLDERKRQVVFSVTDAREANVDASLKVQVYPVDTSKGSSDGIDINQFGGDEVFPWWSDEDESGADEKPSVTPAEGEIGAMGFNRTIVYPYKFDQDLTGQYYIGTSGAFLDCQSCSVRGELDLVVEIRGSLRIGGTFKLSVYVTGSVAGAFKLSGGLKGHTSDGRMTLFYRDFFPYDIPGLFEMDPSFQIYAYASVSTDEALTFNTSIVAQAKNFQVQLIKVGHDSITGSSKVEQIQDLSITTEGPTVVSLDSGRASIDLKTRMAIVPELDITYKVMGQRRQKVTIFLEKRLNRDAYANSLPAGRWIFECH